MRTGLQNLWQQLFFFTLGKNWPWVLQLGARKVVRPAHQHRLCCILTGGLRKKIFMPPMMGITLTRGFITTRRWPVNWKKKKLIIIIIYHHSGSIALMALVNRPCGVTTLLGVSWETNTHLNFTSLLLPTIKYSATIKYSILCCLFGDKRYQNLIRLTQGLWMVFFFSCLSLSFTYRQIFNSCSESTNGHFDCCIAVIAVNMK